MDKTVFNQIISAFIQKEFQTVAEFENLKMDCPTQDIINTIEQIITEKYIHIGQLEGILTQVNPLATNIDQGKEGQDTLQPIFPEEIEQETDEPEKLILITPVLESLEAEPRTFEEVIDDTFENKTTIPSTEPDPELKNWYEDSLDALDEDLDEDILEESFGIDPKEHETKHEKFEEPKDMKRYEDSQAILDGVDDDVSDLDDYVIDSL